MTEPAPPARGTGRASRAPRPSIAATVLTLLALAAGACSGGTPAGSPAAGSASAVAPSASVASSVPTPTSLVVPVNPTPVTDPRVVPASVIDAAKADAATQAGVDPAGVTLVSADAIDWPSGALGCPRQGFLYTDVITPGYRIVVEADGHRYDYRASARDGAVRWCENPPPVR